MSNVKVVKLNSSSKVASIYRWGRLSKNIPEDHESGERREMNLSGDWVWKNEKKKMHLDKPNIREEKRRERNVLYILHQYQQNEREENRHVRLCDIAILQSWQWRTKDEKFRILFKSNEEKEQEKNGKKSANRWKYSRK
jgi:hypothetical protein